MAQPKRKTAAAPASAATPQFRVVGKEETAAPVGLNFGALGVSIGKKETKAAHPVLPLDAESKALVAQYLEHIHEFKKLDKLVGSKGSIKAQLAPLLRGAYFRFFAGRPLDESRLLGPDGVKFTFKEAYSKLCTDLATLIKACPPAAPHVQLSATLKIDLDSIPASKQQPFVDAILAAAQELEITEGITASQCVQPKPGFHQQRTILLTPEQNIAFDSVIPITAYPQV